MTDNVRCAFDCAPDNQADELARIERALSRARARCQSYLARIMLESLTYGSARMLKHYHHWIRVTVAVALAALLTASAVAQESRTPRRLLLLGQGPDGHPRATHEYFAGL